MTSKQEYKLTELQTEVNKIITHAQEARRQNMRDTITSFIRTYVPIAVGALISLLTSINIDVDAQTQTALIVALTGLIQAAYYALARLIEKKYPFIGRILLGSSKQPTYEK